MQLQPYLFFEGRAEEAIAFYRQALGAEVAALMRFREAPTEENKREIHRLVREEAPLVPLIYGQSVVVHSRRMRNVTMSATGVLSLAGVTLS